MNNVNIKKNKISLFGKQLVFFTLILFTLNSSAQLVVNSNVSTNQMVSNLIAQGLTVSNVRLRCAQGAYGTFNGSASNIGIANGIVLTTGSADTAVGPNAGTGDGLDNQLTFTDTNLISLEPQATLDPCVLEFDVIPRCDSLEIRFVFGSDEYMEYVGRSFNDAFGFFITGPNPVGPAYNNTNIAWLPGTTTPVSVDSVNLNTNSSFYFDNETPPGTTVEYDGFTRVLIVKVRLVPCSTYHFKIAIADAGDHIYDSGVFIDYMSCSNLLTINPSSTPATSCVLCNGTANATVSGGNTPYSYSWSANANAGNTSSVTGLCPGNYTVTVTDNSSCPIITTQTVYVSGNNNFAVTSSQTDIPCNSSCIGTASVVATGGAAGYTYTWSNGNNTASVSNVCAGIYTCTVADAGGCRLVRTFTITNTPFVVTQGQSNSGCSASCAGSAAVIVLNGTAPYVYAWDPPISGAAAANSLCAGLYTATVTDANGCSTTKSFNIIQIPQLVTTQSYSDATCNSNCNGIASVTVTSGTAPYIYSWTPSVSTAASVTGLCSGSYDCVVQDANGCTVTENFYISQNNPLYAYTNQTDVTCSTPCNGTATINPSGGMPSYVYSWLPSGGTNITATGLCSGTYTCEVSDSVGCKENIAVTIYDSSPLASSALKNDATCAGCDGMGSVNPWGGSWPYQYNWFPSGGTDISATGLCQGTYTCNIIDASGCVMQQTVTVSQPTGLQIVPIQNNVRCNSSCDGSAEVNVSGGLAPYNYLWTANVSVASVASNLCAGVYSCSVTDAAGCLSIHTFTITAPSVLTATIVTTNVSCSGGSNATATAQANGGSGGYTYSWNNPQTSSLITGLTAGNFSMTVTDMNGCTSTATVSITQPVAVTLTVSSTPTSCTSPTGTASMIAGGGTGAYTYYWNTIQTTTTITALNTGIYNALVSDANGCTSTGVVNVGTVNGPTVSISSSTNVSCNGGNDGTVTAGVAGGSGPYVYGWNTVPAQQNTTATGLVSGNYTVAVTDANGCSSVATATIAQPAALTFSISSTPTSCGGSTGTAMVSPSSTLR